MEISMELLQKAKTAGNAKELLAMARESGIALTPEDAEQYYSRLHQNGELSDEELDNVAGGGCISFTPPRVCPNPNCHSNDFERLSGINCFKCKRCGTVFRYNEDSTK